MKINNIILILLVALVGLSCQSIKDGLSGKKMKNLTKALIEMVIIYYLFLIIIRLRIIP